MKLNEISDGKVNLTTDENGFLIERNAIFRYLRNNLMNYVNTDFSIDSYGNVFSRDDVFFKDDMVVQKNGALKVKFFKIDGMLDVSRTRLTSFIGFPREVQSIRMDQCAIKSLVGFNEVVQKVNGGMITFSGKYVEEGGICLLLIPDLFKINDMDTQPQFDIIEKYIGRPDDIFECQAELIEAGYEEHAKL